MFDDNAKRLKVRLTFAENVLGTSPADKEIYERFVASKSPDADTVEEEVDALGVDHVVEKGMTIFPRNEDGVPILYDYQIKGFFKDSCGGLRKVPGSESSKIKAYKREIDRLVFVYPRQIAIQNCGTIGTLQRPLRGQTAQGERISLAISDEISSGAYIDIEIVCLLPSHEKAVIEWLNYGKYSGIGQWRNSGKGRFTWELVQ